MSAVSRPTSVKEALAAGSAAARHSAPAPERNFAWPSMLRTDDAGHGCPHGAFCIYPGMKTWRTGPERHGIYYSYGAHNLHHQFGWHLVYNNQYPVNGVGAGVSLCRGFNGRRGWASEIVVPANQSAAPFMTTDQSAGFANLTPVNSITLWLFDLSGSKFSVDFVCRG